MVRSLNIFRRPNEVAAVEATAVDVVVIPPVPAEVGNVAVDEVVLSDCDLDGMALEAVGKLASIVLDRNQAPNNQHGIHAEISLGNCSLDASNGDRANLIAHGGKVVLEFRGCTYVPRSMNSALNSQKPTSIEVEMSVTTGRQSERQGEASGELATEVSMEGGLGTFKGGAKVAGKAAGRTGRKDGDVSTQVVNAKVRQQIISGLTNRQRVEITIDPLCHANGVVVSSHGRLWNDQVVVVKVDDDEASVTAFYQAYRDGDIALTGGTGVFAELRTPEQQKIVDMLFRRLLSGGRCQMDQLALHDGKDDKNG